MLDKTVAIVCAESGAWPNAFRDNLTGLGVGHVEVVANIDHFEGAIDPDRVNYVFFQQAVGLPYMMKALRILRMYPRGDVKYSPAILMARELVETQLRQMVELGFDDVIQFPCTKGMLRRRMHAQIMTPISYFITSNYFGPDRRLFFEGEAGRKPRFGTRGYERRTFIRSPEHGVGIMDVQVFEPEPADDVSTQIEI
ncbi:hypothetical protein [Maritalea mediterranea]|uniref:Uncharacterized protein n=1 Tax=Maritalea mediterranea TaxID=2909667 RepID=A0ABS9E9P9_9HYPH|nr:hypothetical protein [Maritalea mediterranea]MCF4099605.1 hypothetical protein [Maritalea mediterranea]